MKTTIIIILALCIYVNTACSSKMKENIKYDDNNTVYMNKALDYISGKNIKKDYKKAATILNKLCSNKYPQACNVLSKIYFEGKYGLKKDTSKYMQYQAFSCDYGLSYICIDVAKEFFKREENKKAFIYLEKSCDYNISKGCQVLGLLYEGKNKDQNYKKAMLFYTKGCILNDSLSCYNKANFYLKGFGVEKNYKKAIKYFKKSETLGNKLATKKLNFLKEYKGR